MQNARDHDVFADPSENRIFENASENLKKHIFDTFQTIGTSVIRGGRPNDHDQRLNKLAKLRRCVSQASIGSNVFGPD